MTETVAKTIIAAYPGFAVARCDNQGIWCEEVVAWEVERREGTYHPKVIADGKRKATETWVNISINPITLSGLVTDDSDPWCIRTPSGKYDFVGHRVIESEAAAIAYFRQETE